MKVTNIIFSLGFLICFELSAQKITKRELEGTEWFADNSDNTFEMFNTNINVGDSLILIKRAHTNIDYNSTHFGQQEFTPLVDNNYANFRFRAKSSLVYFLTAKGNTFHTIAGPMPLWNWKVNGKKKIKLYQNGKYKMTLKLLHKEVYNYYLDGISLKTKKIILLRIK